MQTTQKRAAFLCLLLLLREQLHISGITIWVCVTKCYNKNDTHTHIHVIERKKERREQREISKWNTKKWNGIKWSDKDHPEACTQATSNKETHEIKRRNKQQTTVEKNALIFDVDETNRWTILAFWRECVWAAINTTTLLLPPSWWWWSLSWSSSSPNDYESKARSNNPLSICILIEMWQIKRKKNNYNKNNNEKNQQQKSKRFFLCDRNSRANSVRKEQNSDKEWKGQNVERNITNCYN